MPQRDEDDDDPTGLFSLLRAIAWLVTATVALIWGKELDAALGLVGSDLARLVRGGGAVPSRVLQSGVSNISFASATELLGVVIVAFLSRRRQSLLSLDSRIACALFFGSTGLYYLLLPIVVRDPVSIGLHVSLELVNSLIGYAAAGHLASAIDSRPSRHPFARRAPLIGMGVMTLLFLLAPTVAVSLGLCESKRDALRWLSVLGSSPFVAVCGFWLWRAARSAPLPVRAALFLYFAGLALRPVYILWPFLWLGIPGLVYFTLMSCKFASWSVIRSVSVAKQEAVSCQTSPLIFEHIRTLLRVIHAADPALLSFAPLMMMATPADRRKAGADADA